MNENFKININNNPILRTNSTKYLGLFIDENLSWSSHVKELSLQLAKCSGIFYKLKSYVTEDVLRMVYHSLVQSRLPYDIFIWATGT